MREFLVHVFDGGEVHGCILANCRMWTATCLDAHNALRSQRLRARENELIFFCVNVVGNHVNLVAIPEPFAQGLNKGRFARADRAADSDPQWPMTTPACADLGPSDNSHDRNNLVYCVSCPMEARSTMNAADPRSSIVAFCACALAASIASSSSAIASCPSV